MGVAADKTGVWDQVLAFGQYQHATVDGEPVLTVFDASQCKSMLDDFAHHPESDIFLDKQHEIVEAMGDDALDRDKLKEWGDGHALAWANALAMVAGGQVVRYEAHTGAPPEAPNADALRRSDGSLPDGIYALRGEVTPRGADPKDGLSSFRYTSPYFVMQPDGYRLLNLTATNDPRMRGAALAYQRGQRVAMTRVAQENAPATEPAREKPMNELMARAGCMESDTTEGKLEKLTAYAAKMEEEAKKAPAADAEAMAADPGALRRAEEELRDAQEAYGQYASKPDSDEAKRDRKNQLDYAQKNLARLKSMSRGSMGANPFEGKETPEEEKKEAAMSQAMSRKVDVLSEQVKVLAEALKQANARNEEVRTVAMARKQADEEREALVKADEALQRGQWSPDHAGGSDEKDPVKRIALTRQWLAQRLAKGEADFLLPPGTFQPDERVAMSRLTSGGLPNGFPQGRDAAEVDPDVEMSREIGRIQAEADKAGKPVSVAVAMGRVKSEKPRLYAAYERRETEGAMSRRN